MGKLVLFCLETNKKANTDKFYISRTIDKYYSLDNDVSIKYIYMGSKSKSMTDKVEKQIQLMKKQFLGTTVVIYCIDTDNIDSNPVQLKEFYDIQKYCEDKGYKFIWFNRDIEEVYLGKHVVDSDKVKTAKKFGSNELINKVPTSCLKAIHIKRYKSNILNVLDQVFN